MRLAFWRTEKPVARPVLQPGGDSPYAPRLGVWMEAGSVDGPLRCKGCQRTVTSAYIVMWTRDGGAAVDAPLDRWNACQSGYYCEGCGANFVAQLRREREG